MCRVALPRVFHRLHCSAALPNAPLRFFPHRRHSAPHTRDPHQRADGVQASKAYVKRKNDETFVSSFFLLVHFQSSALRKTYLRQFLKAFLKTKKCADFSQGSRGCKAKSTGILCGFRAFLTQQTPLLVEKSENFDFSKKLLVRVSLRDECKPSGAA